MARRRPEKPQRLAMALIALGLVFLLLQSGLLGAIPALLRLLLVLVVGSALWQGTRNLKVWQRLALLGLLLLVVLPTLGELSGVFVLGLPGALFWWTYARDPRRWWAILPAGVLSSLALVVFVEQALPGWDGGPILFLGLAATFSYLYLLPSERGGQRWALFPAIGCIVLTLLSNDPRGSGPGWLLPLVFIGGGLWLLWWWRGRS